MKILAINGGEKAVKTDFPKRGHFGREEKMAAMEMFDECIKSGVPFGYGGEQEEALGREFADFLGGGYADGVNSGTNAVFVSLKALDPKPFSEIVVGGFTDPGGMMPIVMLDCIPVVADAAPDCYNSGPEQIEACITEHTSAIVIAHLGGEPADIPGIMEVAKKHDLPVVEDCSQSHAAMIDGKYVGSFGDISAFSIMFGKHFCCGGQGGMVFSKSEERYWKSKRAADRGKPYGLENANGNVTVSLNCNMDELHAAIGRVQLKKLPRIVESRRAFARMLMDRGLGDLESIIVPELLPNAKHSYWWWRLGVDSDKINCSKDEFCAALSAEGITLNPRYYGALPHTFDWFKNRAEKHPWNNPLCQGNPARDFNTPNVFAAIDKYFNLVLAESWGEQEADSILAAFKKVENAFIK